MPTEINGLPAHVLLIHAIVVLVPLGALATVLSAVWPAARARIGVVAPVLCVICVALVPITQNAGEWLEHKLEANGEDPAIEKHANLGDTFLWYAIALFVVSAAVWYLGRRFSYGLIGMRAATPAPDAPADGSGGGVATATRTTTAMATSTTTRSEPATRTVLPQLASIAIAVVAIAVSALVVWQLYRIGDSGAKASWGYVSKLGS